MQLLVWKNDVLGCSRRVSRWLGFGNKPPPPLPEARWVLATLQSWELAEFLAPEGFSCCAPVQWIFWFKVAFRLCPARAHSVSYQWHSCSWLPLEIFSMENISSELPKHRDHLPFISCSSCGINIKITHSWVAAQRFLFCFPLRNPNVFVVQSYSSPGELVPSGGTGGWELCTHCSCCQWGAGESSLRTFGSHSQAEVGKLGFLKSHSQCARRRRATEGAAGALGLQCPIHNCSPWQEAVLEGTSSCRAPTPGKVLQKVPHHSVERWLHVPGGWEGAVR